MLLPLVSFILALCLPPILITVAYLLSMRSLKQREKATPFECGFDPKNKARIPFSTRFFLLAVIFLVFDIEIVLIMPSPIALSLHLFMSTLTGMFIFILILILGLLHEWREGSLSWS